MANPTPAQVAQARIDELTALVMAGNTCDPKCSACLRLSAAIASALATAHAEGRQAGEALVMAQLCGQAWTQGIRPAIEADSADEFVARVIRAIREESATEARS